MDSPKCRATISTGSTIEVKLTKLFHFSNMRIYSRILEIWSIDVWTPNEDREALARKRELSESIGKKVALQAALVDVVRESAASADSDGI